MTKTEVVFPQIRVPGEKLWSSLNQETPDASAQALRRADPPRANDVETEILHSSQLWWAWKEWECLLCRYRHKRRTFASVGANLGLKGFAGELLGHTEATVTDIYTRAAGEPLHEAAEKIGARIEGILSGSIDPEKEDQERREAKEAKAKGAVS